MKCGAGEGWRRSVWPIVCEMKYYTRVEEDGNFLCAIRTRWIILIGHILRRNCLLKHVTEETIRREGDTSYGKTRKKTQAATGSP